MDKFQIFRQHLGAEPSHACHVAARTIKACDQAGRDWIVRDREYDRNVDVALLAARTVTVPPAVARTCTDRCTNSVANAGKRS